jgi:tetratricopeptide (TPR) repeat protein
MIVSIDKEYDRGLDLLNEGKLEEAWDLAIQIEKREELTPEMHLKIQYLKAGVLVYQGKFEETLKITEKAIQEAIEIKKPYLLILLLLMKQAVAYFIPELRTPLLLLKEYEDAEKLLKASPHKSPSEIKQAEAIINFYRSWLNWGGRELDLALEYLDKCPEAFKQYKELTFNLPSLYLLYGHLYEEKGELDLALEFLKKSLEYAKIEGITMEGFKASAFNKFGAAYYQKGNLDLAIKHYKESINLIEQNPIPIMAAEGSWAYSTLISIFLDKNSPDLAREYLQYFNQYIKKHERTHGEGMTYYKTVWHKLSEARVLKASTRIRERAEAEKILNEILETATFDPRLKAQAAIEICDYYLEELRSTNDLKILDDIQPFITILLEESKHTNSYPLQSQTSLLQGKISLLQMNMGDARRHLTQAEQIAEDHGLQLLAREISKEHDKLLNQLDKWETLKNNDASISERISLAELNNSIDLIQGKRPIKAPELVNEDSVMLLIIAEGGTLLFSYSFSDELKVDDDVFGSFLSAFTTFSNEIFSEGLDRAKFGQFTVLLDTADTFSICYLFKGQTYIAKKKLSDFTESLQSNTSIMQTLNKYNQINQVMEIKDFPFLEGFINRIFAKN